MVSEGTGRVEAGEPAAVNDGNTVPLVEAGDGVDGASNEVGRTILKASVTKSPAEAAELLRADAGNVDATTVAMERSGAERVTGERVIMTRSGANRLEARSAQLDRSGVVSLRSERAVLQAGSAVSVVAGETRLVKSRVGVLVGNAMVEEGARVLVHVGPSAGGVQPVVKTAGAVGVGAAFGVVVLVLGSLVRRLLKG